jgi:ABC-type dipeptide/oligopeptide/nickel transport system permease subunit
MSQVEPTALELPVAASLRRGRGHLHVPGWLALLLGNPKSRLGFVIVAFMVLVALIAPLISVAHPNDFNLLAAHQAPSWHHLFGTTDQGSDVFSQVVLGARRSLPASRRSSESPRPTWAASWTTSSTS